MSGHSKWASIKHSKGKADKQRSKIFSKLSKEISVAAKLGDKDPVMNPRLRSAIQAARSANMPKDNIERAIDKSSATAESNFESLRYEGFGPNKIASQLEGSKIFTKELCKKYQIPTAKFGIFKNIKDSKEFIRKTKYPIVIKADGLASGKGVYICDIKNDAEIAINEIFDGKFGKAENLLIEEFLKGEEMSYFIISDGRTIKRFSTAQDHKRVFEGDKGKNTGGMGAYSPSRLESEVLNNKILNKIINPTIKGLKELNTTFKGFLYAGLMIVDGEPFLIEYNVRMGDPECQTLLPKLKTDFSVIMNKCIEQKLHNLNIDWYDDKSICIVLCSKGYPDSYQNNLTLNLEKLKLNKNQF